MKYLAKIKPEGNGEVIFGKLPIFTRNLKKVLGDNFSTHVEKLDITGRYFAAELSKKPKLDQPSEEENKVLSELTKNGEFVQIKKSSSTVPVSDPDRVVEECENDQEEAKAEQEFKPLPKTQRQIGRERFAKLKALSDNGELALCKNRLDICEKLGYDRTRRHNPCYNWLSAQISRGHLREELVNYKGNSSEYQYSLTGEEPAYSEGEKVEEKEKVTPKPKSELTELGFVNLASKPIDKPKKSTPTEKRLERGDMSLFDWLNKQDYLIYTMFIYGNGQPDINKCIDYDDVVMCFMEAGIPARIRGIGYVKGDVTAENIANISLAALLRKKVLEKTTEDGKSLYSLSLPEGGQYARRVYKTVSEGRYKKNEKTGQRELL